MDDFPVGAFATLVAIVLFVAWCVVFVVVGIASDAKCIRHGFPSSSVTWAFDAYCVKRVNQTDSVVALSKLK